MLSISLLDVDALIANLVKQVPFFFHTVVVFVSTAGRLSNRFVGSFGVRGKSRAIYTGTAMK